MCGEIQKSIEHVERNRRRDDGPCGCVTQRPHPRPRPGTRPAPSVIASWPPRGRLVVARRALRRRWVRPPLLAHRSAPSVDVVSPYPPLAVAEPRLTAQCMCSIKSEMHPPRLFDLERNVCDTLTA